MSAYTSLERTFHFNKTPLAPPGYKVVINENLYSRRTWAPHGTGGWYIGPDMEHYKYHQIYVNATRLESIGDTVELFTNHTKMPLISSADCAKLAASGLTLALLHSNPEAYLKKRWNTVGILGKWQPYFKTSWKNWCTYKGGTSRSVARNTKGGNSCTNKGGS